MTDRVVNLLLKDGYLFIPAPAYRGTMAGLLAVAVLWRSPCLHLIPLHPYVLEPVLVDWYPSADPRSEASKIVFVLRT